MKAVFVLSYLLTSSHAFAQTPKSFNIEQSMNGCEAPMEHPIPSSTLRLILEERVERLANTKCLRQNILTEAKRQGDFDSREYLCGATVSATYSCELVAQ